MASLSIKGTVKDYTNLLTALGISDDTVIDQRWRDFLRKAAGKEVIVTNYNGLKQTFDLVWLIDKPTTTKQGETPVPSGIKVSEFPKGEESRYANNISIKILDSVTCDNCADTIFCTCCGFQVDLDIKHEMLAEYVWRELWDAAENGTSLNKDVADTDGNDENDDPVNGQKVRFDAVKDGLIWCPWHRDYAKFKTIEDSINNPPADKPLTTQEPISQVNDKSAPANFINFKATDDRVGEIVFTWSMENFGYPFAQFDLYNSGGLVAEDTGLGYTLQVTGTDDYYVIAHNSEGSVQSETIQGTGL
jgi:hypothetical protein